MFGRNCILLVTILKQVIRYRYKKYVPKVVLFATFPMHSLAFLNFKVTGRFRNCLTLYVYHEKAQFLTKQMNMQIDRTNRLTPLHAHRVTSVTAVLWKDHRPMSRYKQ